MYELMREWMQKNLDNPRVTWNDEQRAMIEGQIEYTKNLSNEFENVSEKMYNPGRPPEPIIDTEPLPPEEETDGS